MQPCFCIDISFMGFISGGKLTKVVRDAIFHDLGDKPAAISWIGPGQPAKAFPARRFILHVFGSGRLSKIFNPVVGRVAVDVVNEGVRERPIVVQPNKTVFRYCYARNPPNADAVTVQATEPVTDVNSPSGSDLVIESSHLGVVGKDPCDVAETDWHGLAYFKKRHRIMQQLGRLVNLNGEHQ